LVRLTLVKIQKLICNSHAKGTYSSFFMVHEDVG
jgi:hypothetical protein